VSTRSITASPSASVVHDDASNRLAAVEEVERGIDLAERQPARHELVELDSAGEIAVDEPRQLRASLRTAERRAAPRAAGDEEERPRVNLLAGAGDADDDRLAPSLVRARQRLAHDLDVADALEGVVDAAAGHLHDGADDVADGAGIDRIRRAERRRERELRGIDVDRDDPLCAGEHRALNHREA